MAISLRRGISGRNQLTQKGAIYEQALAFYAQDWSFGRTQVLSCCGERPPLPAAARRSKSLPLCTLRTLYQRSMCNPVHGGPLAIEDPDRFHQPLPLSWR
jgi:hypothetical protein